MSIKPPSDERHIAAVFEYRSQILAGQTKPSVYMAIGFIGSMLVLSSILLAAHDLPVIAAGSVVAGLAVLFFGIRKFARKDKAIRAEASLTPVPDAALVRAQYQNVAQMVAELRSLDTKAHTDLMRLAVGRIVQAVEPLMTLGGVTIETASVPGYPAYPEIARTSAIDDDSDFVAFHVLRLDASVHRLSREAHANPPLVEKISAAAGEFIPPLRAIKAELERLP